MALLWIGLVAARMADALSFTVVVRDHLLQTSSEVILTPKLWDSSASASIGTRPGLDGLPTPQPWVENGVIKYRKPLSPFVATVGWPGRITARLDADGHQRCSASLIGSKFALTAAHCVHGPTTDLPIDQGWLSDSFFIRPGYNLGHSISGFDQVRVVKTWLARTKFADIPIYDGDDEWALLELEKDVGTELGWARVTPINYKKPYQWIHMMGYPFIPPDCPKGNICDTKSKTDTLCHSWGDLVFQPSTGTALAWAPLAESWGGESGSGVFHCPDDSCHTGKIDVVGIRWTTNGISAFDSLMSGVVAAILRKADGPLASVAGPTRPIFSLFISGSTLYGTANGEGQWQILSLDGRSVSAPSFGRSLSVAADHLPHGVALVVFRAPGQAPVTRRWVTR